MPVRRATPRTRETSEILARSLIHDAMVFAAEAEVRWLGHVAARLAAQPRHAFALALASEKPRRGRRARRTLEHDRPSDRPAGA
jgi:hypothetical protein